MLFWGSAAFVQFGPGVKSLTISVRSSADVHLLFSKTIIGEVRRSVTPPRAFVGTLHHTGGWDFICMSKDHHDHGLLFKAILGELSAKATQYFVLPAPAICVLLQGGVNSSFKLLSEKTHHPLHRVHDCMNKGSSILWSLSNLTDSTPAMFIEVYVMMSLDVSTCL